MARDNHTILVVEDNFENRILVRRVLQAEGYTLLETDSAAGALEILRSRTPHLVLMDINMPGVDGYTLTAQLRQQASMERVPIVALTANMLKGDRERSLNAGCDGYIHKPIDVDALPRQIQNFLKAR